MLAASAKFRPALAWFARQIAPSMIATLLAALVIAGYNRAFSGHLASPRLSAVRAALERTSEPAIPAVAEADAPAKLKPVWTTNLAGFLLGIGMYSAFVLIPQFVETPTSNGYGFGSSVTQAGLFLIPSTIAIMVASPVGGRLSGRFGSKVPLVLGSTITMLAFLLLAVAHSAHWQVYLASLLLGVGIRHEQVSPLSIVGAGVCLTGAWLIKPSSVRHEPAPATPAVVR